MDSQRESLLIFYSSSVVRNHGFFRLEIDSDDGGGDCAEGVDGVPVGVDEVGGCLAGKKRRAPEKRAVGGTKSNTANKFARYIDFHPHTARI
jgi:hypothetical protein